MSDIDRTADVAAVTEVLTKALHEAETTGGWWGHPECEEFARIAAPAVAPLLAAAHTGGQESVREAITQPHLRASTDAGPDYCSTCSEAVQDWVVWPCAAVRPARAEHGERIVSGVRAWCAINEIAEPPLDWEGLGEFLSRIAREASTEDAR